MILFLSIVPYNVLQSKGGREWILLCIYFGASKVLARIESWFSRASHLSFLLFRKSQSFLPVQYWLQTKNDSIRLWHLFLQIISNKTHLRLVFLAQLRTFYKKQYRKTVASAPRRNYCYQTRPLEIKLEGDSVVQLWIGAWQKLVGGHRSFYIVYLKQTKLNRNHGWSTWWGYSLLCSQSRKLFALSVCM